MSEKRQYVFDVLCKLLPHRFISSEKIEGKNPSKERGFPHYLISTSEMNYGDNSIVGPIPNMNFNGFNLKNDIDRNTKGVDNS